jgi:hypothetical protein
MKMKTKVSREQLTSIHPNKGLGFISRSHLFAGSFLYLGFSGSGNVDTDGGGAFGEGMLNLVHTFWLGLASFNIVERCARGLNLKVFWATGWYFLPKVYHPGRLWCLSSQKGG